MILIIAPTDDEDAWAVQRLTQEVYGQQAVLFRVDLTSTDVRTHIYPEANSFEFHAEGVAYSIDDFSTAWFRTPVPMEHLSIPLDPSDSMEYVHALTQHYYHETLTYANYIAHRIKKSCSRVLGSSEMLHNKLTSLEHAQTAGLNVLETYVLNTKQRYNADILQSDTAFISKNIFTNFVYHDDTHRHYTAAVTFDKAELHGSLNAFFMPSLFQENTNTPVELKVFYLDGTLTACRIEKQGKPEDASILDLKEYAEMQGCVYNRYVLSDADQEKITRFMQLHDYNFGVLDFAVKGDELFFLEVNPHGMYDIVSHVSNVNLNLSIAKYLCQTH